MNDYQRSNSTATAVAPVVNAATLPMPRRTGTVAALVKNWNRRTAVETNEAVVGPKEKPNGAMWKEPLQNSTIPAAAVADGCEETMSMTELLCSNGIPTTISIPSSLTTSHLTESTTSSSGSLEEYEEYCSPCKQEQKQQEGGGRPRIPRVRHSTTTRTTTTTKSSGKQPRDVICHICGRKYTIHSIDIHLPQCTKLYHQRQELLPESERKPIPRLPANVDKMTLPERNQVAWKLYENVTLEACQYCQRTFLPDRLQVHLPSCARHHDQVGPPKPPPPPPSRYDDDNSKPMQARNTVLCHVCGRKYTIHSIDIHLPRCERLWRQRQATLPVEQRRPLPQLPDQYYNNTTAAAAERHEMAMDVYHSRSLTPCQYCHRTFLPDRLEVHRPSCQRNYQKQQRQQQQQQQQQQQRQQQRQGMMAQGGIKARTAPLGNQTNRK
eukprot:CAMPEP_0168821600 /NCGR_PEP_ID=MMETSP0726-20121227/9492_1 /TAXON_ID=265536 /ORGANISM="Amphiprora sp., Strain CCMP467" /LENGTH=437 /DNA_ID=CAMNT_0008874235 /DNA_START=897 /DNA_END=2210 /DNA_ORIENTATION=-